MARRGWVPVEARGRGRAPARVRARSSCQCLVFFSLSHLLISSLSPLLFRPATDIVITDVVPPSDLFEVKGEPTAKVER
jgi:hypothetical protein